MHALVFRTLSLVAGLLVGAATAQCPSTWGGDPLPYVRGDVLATTTWDPDGVGPAPTNLVVGGDLSVGTTNAKVALWNGSQWQTLPSLAPVRALTVWNGNLIAATATTIQSWNGTQWQTLGIAVSAPNQFTFVNALRVYGGRLYVGGDFDGVGNIAAGGIASFDGTSWSAVGNGVFGEVATMTEFNGLLFVGGNLQVSGGPGTNLASWNGSSWVATATVNGTVLALTVQTSLFNAGQLFVGGSFSLCNGFAATNLARYSDFTGTWSAVAGGLPAPCTALCANNGLLNGTDVVATVDHPANSTKAWRWNGTTWSAMPPVADALGDPSPSCTTVYGGVPIVGLRDAAQAVRSLAGNVWVPLQQPGVQDPVLAIDANGPDLVIGGWFTTLYGVPMNGVARGTPGNWQPLGSGAGFSGTVQALARNGGTIYAAGSFANLGGTAANNIAQWNGTAWNALGSGVNGTVWALCLLANGDLVATGDFTLAGGVACNRIARWNGSTWSALGTGLTTPFAGTPTIGRALATTANGDLLVGGDFSRAGGIACTRVARWNGSTWGALGSGVDNTVNTIAVRPDGSIAVGGAFLNAGAVSTPYVALWDGSAWSSAWQLGPHPLGPVATLTALPDGDLIGGGAQWSAPSSFPFSAWTSALMRWRAGQWSPLGVLGIGVWASALASDGTLAIAGEFAVTGSTPHGNVARLTPGCPALAGAYGTGCSGSGGLDMLATTALPWLGSTFRGRATGLPATGFAVVVTGFAALALPIQSLLPEGLPGCTLLVTPDSLEPALPSAGELATQLAIPNNAALLGVQVRQQVAPFETNALGAVTAITSTNALLLTIGML